MVQRANGRAFAVGAGLWLGTVGLHDASNIPAVQASAADRRMRPLPRRVVSCKYSAERVDQLLASPILAGLSRKTGQNHALCDRYLFLVLGRFTLRTRTGSATTCQFCRGAGNGNRRFHAVRQAARRTPGALERPS